MCIVSLVLNESESILTFNRDEDNQRSFAEPEYRFGSTVFCPLDLVSGGTWIGINDRSVICIQNGGDIKHKRDLPYTKSRGIILLDLLKENNMAETLARLSSQKIEPFSIFSFNRKTRLSELLVYDGRNPVLTRLNRNKLFVRCSATLYSPQLSFLIKQGFEDLKTYNPDSVLRFHMDYRIGGPKNKFLSRPLSSSITQFVLKENNTVCRFQNLLSGQNSVYQIK